MLADEVHSDAVDVLVLCVSISKTV